LTVQSEDLPEVCLCATKSYIFYYAISLRLLHLTCSELAYVTCVREFLGREFENRDKAFHLGEGAVVVGIVE
jgi:hypothetical protein